MSRCQLGDKYLLSGVSRNISACITPLSTSHLIFSLLYPPQMRTFPSGKATITQPDQGACGVPVEKSQRFAVLHLTTHPFHNTSSTSFLRVSATSFLITSYTLDASKIFISLLIMCTMLWYFKVVSFVFELHLTVRTLNGVHPYICLYTADY